MGTYNLESTTSLRHTMDLMDAMGAALRAAHERVVHGRHRFHRLPVRNGPATRGVDMDHKEAGGH